MNKEDFIKVRLSLELTATMIKQLDEIAKTFYTTRTEIIRLFLSEGIKTYYTWHKEGGEKNEMHTPINQS